MKCQWRKDGAALADGGHIAGATTAWLTLTNVLGADAGGYHLVVSNAYGARSSGVATLTVIDPVITVPPAGQNREPGEAVTLTVTAVGTAPLGYQWWKDGVALMGRTAAHFTLTNLLVTDAGSYWVAVASPYGRVTSPAALLTVNQATTDPGFNPGAGLSVHSLAVQADGKILVGGSFTTLGGQTCNHLGQINPDGTLDPGFNPGASSAVYCLVVQADGKILVGGYFTTLGGQTRNYLGRLNATEPATQTLSSDGSTITWLRGGASPEVWRTTFDWSSDGLLWIPLGEGTRIPAVPVGQAGGWQRTDAVVPVDATIRARGFVTGGRYNGSGWFVESLNRPGPDLHVASWDTPLQAMAGTPVTVAWTLLNRGRLPATNGWVDRVYLSPNASLINGWLLGEFPVSGPLASNVQLARSQSVTLPPTLEPDRDYWWIIVIDATNALIEEIEENEANNTRVSELPMRVLHAPAPNLRGAFVSTPANPMSGQSVSASWTVTNAGTWSTGAGFWQDAVYLSADTVVDASDFLLGRGQRPRPLGTNESYSNSLTAILPQGLSGTRYFIVQTDADHRVNEGAFEADNTGISAPVTITLTPRRISRPPVSRRPPRRLLAQASRSVGP